MPKNDKTNPTELNLGDTPSSATTPAAPPVEAPPIPEAPPILSASSPENFKPFKIRLAGNKDNLNIRAGPSIDTEKIDHIEAKDRGTYTIVAVENGYGKLEDGRGYISLQYTKPG